MAKQNFNRLIDRVLKAEGGFTNDKRDPGNWTGGKVGVGKLLGTNMGIAANSYPTEDIRGLTRERAKALYRRDYWNKVGGDRLPSGLDYALLDYAINSGVSRAVREIQRIVGARVDGVMGEATLARIDAAAEEGGTERLIVELCDRRLAFMRGLKTWGTFGKGWTKRVNQVRSAALAMAKGGSVAQKVQPSSGRNDKALPTDQKATASAEGKAAATTAAGTAGATAIETAEKLSEGVSEVQSAIEPISWYLEWAQYACLALVLIGGCLTVWLVVRKAREG